jgi:putative flavoprotein involved in K+ transport
MVENFDTIVIGGGQAGLSVSWHLNRIGREHVVLDRGRVGDTWRRRWDSFCLVTPNCYCQLPGFPYDGDEPDGFMLRDEIVAYIERYAASFDPPYRSGVEVRGLGISNGDGRFLLETSAGELEASHVIVSVGTHQHPNLPAWHDRLAGDILRIHTHDYRNPAQLPDGAVLVVGSGQSGCQVAEDLLGAGREVHLCVGNAGRIPRRYRGRDIIHWLVDAGRYEGPVDEHPKGSAIRYEPHEHLSGRDGGRTIDLRRLALEGECAETLAIVDEYIATSGTVAPESDLESYDWRPPPESNDLDLRDAGIGSVVYGTGYRYDFGWIDLPIFDERRYPRYRRGVTDVPGLYFVGQHWLHTAGSGLFYQVGRDAEYVVDHLCRAGG